MFEIMLELVGGGMQMLINLKVRVTNLTQLIGTAILECKQGLTFEDFVGVAALAVPWRVAVLCKVAKLQVTDGESDDRGLVELAGDGGGKWKHFGQFVKLIILFAAS